MPRRPLVIALTGFSALSALGGGLLLLVSGPDEPYLPPIELLRYSPFEDFLVPGLLLGLAVGGTSTGAALLAWRRSGWATDATFLAGGTLTVWIVAELAILREAHWLHGVYGVLGVAILGLGASAALRSSAPRHRWVVLVTSGETLGFMAPASVGMLLARAHVEDARAAVAIVVAGAFEGLALGTGQAWAFPVALRRGRFALLTGLGAGLVWSLAMTVVWAFGTDQPGAVAVSTSVVAGIGGLLAIGTAQWLELRRHVERSGTWIAWTALAWALALPWSFAPSPFVDEATPLPSAFALFASGGALMAYTMALVTWLGARRWAPSEG